MDAQLAGMRVDYRRDELDVGDLATPTVTDVDGDGRLDLLVGNNDGNVQRYEQTAVNGATFA